MASAVRQPIGSYDWQKNVIYRHLSLYEHFSAVSNLFWSRLSLVIPMGEGQQTGKPDLTTGRCWSAHRQSKIDF
jgi:hypothetical protein